MGNPSHQLYQYLLATSTRLDHDDLISLLRIVVDFVRMPWCSEDGRDTWPNMAGSSWWGSISDFWLLWCFHFSSRYLTFSTPCHGHYYRTISNWVITSFLIWLFLFKISKLKMKLFHSTFCRYLPFLHFNCPCSAICFDSLPDLTQEFLL